VSGSHFNDPLELTIGRDLIARGTFDDEITGVLSMYVWVVQVKDGEANNDASASAELGKNILVDVASRKWEAQMEYEDATAGRFSHGPAFGFATAIVKDKRLLAKERVVPWTDAILLEPPQSAS